jgi:hypothetical protein
MLVASSGAVAQCNALKLLKEFRGTHRLGKAQRAFILRQTRGEFD